MAQPRTRLHSISAQNSDSLEQADQRSRGGVKLFCYTCEGSLWYRERLKTDRSVAQRQAIGGCLGTEEIDLGQGYFLVVDLE